jgi:hypothetical protein
MRVIDIEVISKQESFLFIVASCVKYNHARLDGCCRSWVVRCRSRPSRIALPEVVVSDAEAERCKCQTTEEQS